jgi:hypothetical protein
MHAMKLHLKAFLLPNVSIKPSYASRSLSKCSHKKHCCQMCGYLKVNGSVLGLQMGCIEELLFFVLEQVRQQKKITCCKGLTSQSGS